MDLDGPPQETKGLSDFRSVLWKRVESNDQTFSTLSTTIDCSKSYADLNGALAYLHTTTLFS